MDAPDLNQTAPRSPWIALGGFTIAARVVDRCRATVAGTNGEYHYNCPIDRTFLAFTGLGADELKSFVATGADDAAVGTWISEHARIQNPVAKFAWSTLCRLYPMFLLMQLDDWIHVWRRRR